MERRWVSDRGLGDWNLELSRTAVGTHHPTFPVAIFELHSAEAERAFGHVIRLHLIVRSIPFED
jgi:hypothetical protein